MKKQELVTQSYVMLPDETGHTLKYYLVKSEAPGKDSYGVVIESYLDRNLRESATAYFMQAESTVREYIDRFAMNFLFPCSLTDVVEDMQCENLS